MSSLMGETWAERHHLMSQRLRHRRAELGLTQKQVVSRLGRVGVMTTNRALSSLERGAGLDVAKLPELADVLDCTVTYLIGLTDDPHSWAPDADPRPSPAREPPSVNGAAAARRGRSLILGDEIPDRRRRGES